MNTAAALLSFRPHLLAAIVMFILIGSMVVQPDQNVRLLTIIPILGTYFAFMILYALEIDVLSASYQHSRQSEMTGEIQRASSELAALNGLPVHERHMHLRAIEFPVQQPRLSETAAYDYAHSKVY